ncbi:hypothetical protein G3580_19010 [Nitrogeniibacter mangrovi]|uniref:Uncharacterized protein n=1 Tax=Nitrogeniibacter mangrovi TaxID=2016596 RepID=A0A6C1BB70_9RHOO|nr:hypothetical protein [Nitrogeniibacter mangrovi]QID19524.1 hypothetical protein G3580_19010 [Nitrogeniibacter mangrovi]
MQVDTPLMEKYQALFFNENFCEAASTTGLTAYRGEFTLKEGEIADAQGRRKPPERVLKQVVLLTAADKLRLLSGSLDALQDFPLVVEKFGEALDAESRVVLFTVNIDDPFIDTVMAPGWCSSPWCKAWCGPSWPTWPRSKRGTSRARARPTRS